jgi:hypothetical protein
VANQRQTWSDQPGITALGLRTDRSWPAEYPKCTPHLVASLRMR